MQEGSSGSASLPVATKGGLTAAKPTSNVLFIVTANPAPACRMLATVTSNCRRSSGTPAAASGSCCSRLAAAQNGQGVAAHIAGRPAGQGTQQRLRMCLAARGKPSARAASKAPFTATECGSTCTSVCIQLVCHAVESCIGLCGLHRQRLNVGAHLRNRVRERCCCVIVGSQARLQRQGSFLQHTA